MIRVAPSFVVIAALCSCAKPADITAQDIAAIKVQCAFRSISANGPFGIDGDNPPNLFLDPGEPDLAAKRRCLDDALRAGRLRADVKVDAQFARQPVGIR